MNYDHVRQADPEIFASMQRELERQRNHIELIASSINSAVAGGSDDAFALIPADDMTLARAVLGLAQSDVEFASMFEGEVTSND